MSEIIINSMEEFDAVVNGDKVTLVDFWASWCGPCKMLMPTIEEVAKELDGTANVAKLNVDDNEDIAVKFKIMSIPTLMIFKNGEMKEKMIGLRAKQQIIDAIMKNA